MPYGLNLMLRALGAATHNGDAVAALDLSPAVDRLRQKIRNPDYVSERLRSLILDNPHRVTLIVAPDPNLDQQRKKDESAKLSEIRSGLDDADIDALRKLASDLEARQNQVDDANILPKVDVEDIPRDVSSSKVSATPLSDSVRHYIGDAGTNGLVYQQIALGLPNLSSDQQAHLPLRALATEVGIGGLLPVRPRSAISCCR